MRRNFFPSTSSRVFWITVLSEVVLFVFLFVSLPLCLVLRVRTPLASQSDDRSNDCSPIISSSSCHLTKKTLLLAVNQVADSVHIESLKNTRGGKHFKGIVLKIYSQNIINYDISKNCKMVLRENLLSCMSEFSVSILFIHLQIGTFLTYFVKSKCVKADYISGPYKKVIICTELNFMWCFKSLTDIVSTNCCCKSCKKSFKIALLCFTEKNNSI